jgi:hypothetical protein
MGARDETRLEPQVFFSHYVIFTIRAFKGLRLRMEDDRGSKEGRWIWGSRRDVSDVSPPQVTGIFFFFSLCYFYYTNG